MKKYGLIIAALLLLLLTLCGTALAVEDCGDGNHTWKYRNEVPATCLVDGSHEKYCTVCGKIAGTEPIIHIGHKENTAGEVVKAATCLEAGRREYACFVCKEVLHYDVLQPLGHDMGEWYNVTRASCGKAGLDRRDCQRSGCNYYETREITALVHDITDWIEDPKATCTTAGLKYRYCKNMCGLYETETLKALGHDYHETGSKAADCTNGGYKDLLCYRCGDTKRETTGKLGHLWGEWNQTVNPTCIKKGTAQRSCQRPGCTAKETKDVDMLPHNWTEWAQVEVPTCLKKGKAERHCTYGCGTKETKDIDKLPHNWTEWAQVEAPTCLKKGKAERHCTYGCGAQETRDTKALGHDWTEWEITKQPTCDEPGERKHSCKRNGCDTVETEKIPAKQHDWGPWIIDIKPSYTEEGERHRECKNCHEIQREKIPKRTYANNTMCAMGPRLRDVDLSPNPNSEMWYMFTPIDVFMDGVQVYDLVASNLYTVGTMTVTIKDGFMTVEYKLNDNVNIDVELEFYTVVSSMSELSEYEPEKLLSYRLPVGQPINLEEKFGDDNNLVIYFCSRIDYKFNPATMHSLYYDSLKNQKLIKHMLSLMD